MDLDAIARDLSAACSVYWLKAVSRLRERLAALPLTAAAVGPVLERARGHALRDQKGRAANWLAVAFILDQAKTLAWLKKKGLLRTSYYQFEPAVPRFLADQVLTHADDLALNAQARSMLGAIASLLRIAPAARAEFSELMQLFRSEPYTVLRSCLITLDLLFMREGFKDRDFGLPWTLDPYSKEDLAEGFSLLWSHAHREVRVTRRSAGLWDPQGVYHGRYLRVLKRAAGLREYLESEILIEAFGYRCVIHGDGTAVVTPPAPEVEKGIRLGYIEGEMRRMRLLLEAGDVGAGSLRDLGQQIHASLKEKDFIRLVDAETPLARVRFEFPLIPQYTAMLRDIGAAREELPGVAEAIEAYGMTPAQAREYRVGEHLTIQDVQHVQRLAAVTAFCVGTELYERRKEPVIFVNSASPVYRTDEALDAFLRAVLDAERAREFREMFRWPPASPDAPGGLDVQYRPLLEAEHEWHVPMFVLAFSDLTRAAFMLTRQRPNQDSDLLEAPIVRAFRETGQPAIGNVKLRDGDRVIAEIDVAALVDDVLVILECKNAILPCNVFELRTSQDRCVEAAEQLDRASAALAVPAHRDALLARLGCRERPVAYVVTAIVVGNRLFIGSRFGRHLVVSPGHLGNFIVGGDIHLGKHSSPMRAAGALTGAAMREFFAGSFYDRMFGAMVQVERVAEVAGTRVKYESYALDVIALGREFGIDIEPRTVAG